MHRGLTAHARARYRCFLPDLAGLAGVRRVRPMPDLTHSSIPQMLVPVQRRSPDSSAGVPPAVARACPELAEGAPRLRSRPFATRAAKVHVTFGASFSPQTLPFCSRLSNNSVRGSKLSAAAEDCPAVLCSLDRITHTWRPNPHNPA